MTRHADLNNDGREDLLTVNSRGGFDVLLSTGDGTYGSPASYTIPGGADTFLLSLGDFNGDGKADVVAIGTDKAIHLFLNSGSGKFSQSAAFPVQNVISLNDIAVEDFNHDGLMDIAFINALNLTVWFGNGKGGFTVGPTTPVSNTDYLMLGDFDGDGRADLAIGDRLNYDSVQVLYGDRTGHFPVKRLIQTTGGHSGFEAADVNGDGKMDIIGSQFYPSAHSWDGTTTRGDGMKNSQMVAMRDGEVWVDGKARLQLDGFSNYTFLNRSLGLAAGSHPVAIYAAGWDQSLQKKTLTLKVK